MLKILACVFALGLLLSSFSTQALAASTSTELFAVAVGKGQALQFLVANNDVPVDGTSDADMVMIRLYDADRRLIAETPRTQISRGGCGTILLNNSNTYTGTTTVIAEVIYIHDTPGKKGARWQTTMNIVDVENGEKILIGMLLPAVQKVR